MISLDEILKIHAILVEKFGGSDGVRDNDLLESAINRPYQTFDGQELYPSALEKAAAILESIVKNHPFMDGNKRTGYVLARLILMEAELDINADQTTKYEFVIDVSINKLDYDQIKEWLLQHVIKTGD